MPPLLERLREALAPEYEVQRKLAAGGMGVVFLALDVSLGRPVAIKVIAPELATARIIERFEREARILAQMNHPNILAVHKAGRAGGLFYYVMDYVSGPTLAERLKEGPLTSADGLKILRDVLDGLEAAHRAGVVHRDIKPGNVFLVGSRALVGDFGIAHIELDDALTDAGKVIGTPAYMAPEQSTGGEVTLRTDIYSAGAVLFESLTGRRWKAQAETTVDWTGVPWELRSVVRKALADDPRDRWEDAVAFRRAAWRTRSRRYVRRTQALTAGGLAVGALGMWWFATANTDPTHSGGLPHVDVPRFVTTSGDGGIGDSIATRVARLLGGFPDFTVSTPADRARHAASIVLSGSVLTDTGRIRIRMHARGNDPPGDWAAATSRQSPDWDAIADSLSHQFLVAWYQRTEGGPVPAVVLPRTPQGFRAWLRAEQLVAGARWGEAYEAYAVALGADSTCLLCAWRLTEVERWLGLPHDAQYVAAYRDRVDSFPPRYQSLIRASFVPLEARLDTLQSAAERTGFHLAEMLFGDELFHRGPLAGRSRYDAVEPLRRAARLRPGFAPAFEHLAWLLIPTGDSTGARTALDSLSAVTATHGQFSALHALLELGFAWRFFPERGAIALTEQVLGQPAVAADPNIETGPRWMMTFDTPTGAIWLGRQFALQSPRGSFRPPGWIAQVLGHFALGHVDSARALARHLSESTGSASFRLFAAGLDVMLARFDPPASAPISVPRSTVLNAARSRAAWLRGLVSDTEAEPPAENVLAGEAEPRPFTTLLRAARLARDGHADSALQVTAALTQLDSAGRGGDPFFRSALHLLRAEWHEALNDIDGARRELLWHENLDVVGYLSDEPQSAEIDWALGTLARWKRARLLDRAGRRGVEVCRLYGDVHRLWKNGDARYATRADSAASRRAELGCQQ